MMYWWYFLLVGMGIAICCMEGYGVYHFFQMREGFQQVVSRKDKRPVILLSSLLIVSVLLLFSSFTLLYSWADMRIKPSGIAFVIDMSNDSDVQQVVAEKTVVETLLRHFQGVSVSLYESFSKNVYQICPPTIDHIFCRLQLDTMERKSFSGEKNTLSSIQNSVWNQEQFHEPFIIVVQGKKVPFVKELNTKLGASSSLKDISKEKIRNMATVIVTPTDVTFTIFENEMMHTYRLQELFVGEIHSILYQNNPYIDLSDYGIQIVSGLCLLAFCLYLLYRRYSLIIYVVPFLTLGSLSSITPQEANQMCQKAADLAKCGAYDESRSLLEQLLDEADSDQMYNDCVYNLALLEYSANNLPMALSWLASLRNDHSENELRRIYTLQTCIYIRQFQEAGGEERKKETFDVLKKWVDSKPPVFPDVLDSALFVLYGNLIDIQNSVEMTLHWFLSEWNLHTAGSFAPFLASTIDIVNQTKDVVATYINKLFDKSIHECFCRDIQHVSDVQDIYRVYVWYALAKAETIHESIQILLNEGSIAANSSLFFPAARFFYQQNVFFIENLLRKFIRFLPSEEQQMLDWNPFGVEEKGAFFFALAHCYPVLLENFSDRYWAMLRQIAPYVVNSPENRVKKILAEVALHFCSMDSKSILEVKNPLLESVRQILLQMYTYHRVEALDFVINQAVLKNPFWVEERGNLLRYSIEQDGEFSSITKVLRSTFVEPTNIFSEDLFTRLWQIGLIRVNTMEAFETFLVLLKKSYIVLSEMMQHDEIQMIHNLNLMVVIAPEVEKIFKKATSLIPKEKGIRYQEYSHIFHQYQVMLEKMVLYPETFRKKNVQEYVFGCIDVITNMLALVQETAKPPLERIENRDNEIFQLEVENAVRLFLELERADRALFGDVR